jgi:hypothetical protein
MLVTTNATQLGYPDNSVPPTTIGHPPTARTNCNSAMIVKMTAAKRA